MFSLFLARSHQNGLSCNICLISYVQSFWNKLITKINVTGKSKYINKSKTSGIDLLESSRAKFTQVVILTWYCCVHLIDVDGTHLPNISLVFIKREKRPFLYCLDCVEDEIHFLIASLKKNELEIVHHLIYTQKKVFISSTHPQWQCDVQ